MSMSMCRCRYVYVYVYVLCRRCLCVSDYVYASAYMFECTRNS